MRLPKRVPWSHPAELEQIYTWIYADEDGSKSTALAINRLSAWKASTALPHALDSTLSLLMVMLQDGDSANGHAPPLIIRQSYSLALIRLVNGLVDPLQQGAYARSIASIAAQIGLPLWLVELRHASTHEELPSLELLREGAHEAMTWLLYNYFLPTLSPTNHSTSTTTTLPPLSPLLAQYKQLLKATTRDASLKSRSKPELIRILREMENWLVEAKIAASMLSFETHYNEEDERERWALERLCDALVGRGGLVPISKRKRASPSKALSLPSLPHIAMWSPLILHIQSRYPAFPSVLLSRIVSQIVPLSNGSLESSAFHPSIAEVTPADPTYDQTLASWALWIVDRWKGDPNAECERADVLRELLIGLGRGTGDQRAGRALVVSIAGDDPELKDRVGLLTTTIQSSSRTSPWEVDALETMSHRLLSLRPTSTVTKNFTSNSSPDIGDVEMSASTQRLSGNENIKSMKGWRLLEEGNGWKSCPIGVCVRPDA